MPQIELLNNIPLHSPTPIVGTPFDVKANFEYPFPPDREPTPVSSSAPISSCFHSTSPSHIISISPPPLSMSYNHKLQTKMRHAHTREPPVPPELIRRRRRSVGLRARSPSTERTEGDAREDINRGSVFFNSTDGSADPDTGQKEKRRERTSDGSAGPGSSSRARQRKGDRRAADKATHLIPSTCSGMRPQK